MLGVKMNTILSEWDEAPLSLTQAAQRLGRSTSTLRANCPVQCSEIVRRYEQRKRAQGQLRRASQRREIEEAIKSLLARHAYPSWNRVRALALSVNHPRNGEAIEIYRTVRAQMQDEFRSFGLEKQSHRSV